MSHKKAGGSTSNVHDSNAQRLGIKIYGGQPARAGSIIVRQRGTKFRAGKGVKRAKDDTLFSLTSGIVSFAKKRIKRFNGALKKATVVSVVPEKK